jgi:long-subunit acyl-CoA synthetase (AMP-forming)
MDEKTAETLRTDKKGELCIKKFLMNGYHKNLEQTRKAIDSGD